LTEQGLHSFQQLKLFFVHLCFSDTNGRCHF